MGGIADKSGLGIGQTWQDLLGTRAFGVTYTNTTGKPILVSMSAYNGTIQNVAIHLVINGIAIGNSGDGNGQVGAAYGCISGIVPPNGTYILTNYGTGSLQHWAELR